MADLKVYAHAHQLVGALDVVLHRHRRGQRDLPDLAGHLLDGVLELIARHHLVEQSPLQRFLCGKGRRQQEPVHGAMPVHQQPRFDHRVTAGLAEALRERHLEVGILGGDAEIGQEPQVDPAAHAIAVDLRNRRLRELPQVQRRPQEQIGGALVEILERVPEVGVGVLVRTPPGDMPAAEAVAVRLQDDDLDLLVAVGLV
jgi:hypothetical protein